MIAYQKPDKLSGIPDVTHSDQRGAGKLLSNQSRTGPVSLSKLVKLSFRWSQSVPTPCLPFCGHVNSIDLDLRTVAVGEVLRPGGQLYRGHPLLSEHMPGEAGVLRMSGSYTQPIRGVP